MDTSAATVNSQFVLSARIRRKLGIRKNVRVTFIERDSRLIIQPLDKGYFEIMAGILGSKGKMMRELMEEKKEESAT